MPRTFRNANRTCTTVSAISLHALERKFLRRAALTLALCAAGFAGALPGVAAAESFPAVIPLSSLDGSNGFRIDGELAGHELGSSVAGAGDINGDGYDDVIVGAPYAGFNNNNAGGAYVVFGHSGAFSHPLMVASLDGSNGFEIPGVTPGDRFGWSVSSAGDVNADGYSDLLIGAWKSDLAGTDAGSSFVLFGKSGGFSSTEFLFLNGTNGFAVGGAVAEDHSGYSVSAAGDHDGDGFDDLLLGAPEADQAEFYSGTSHVVFGKSSGFPSLLELDGMIDGSAAYALVGGQIEDRSGYSVSAAGDINGDGFDDVIVGADPAGGTFARAGRCYVVFGKASGFLPFTLLAGLNGVNGFRLQTSTEYDYFGTSVSGAGDINGDGFDDLIIGAYGNEVGSNLFPGSSYVVFGHSGTFSTPFNMDSLNGSNGFRLDGVQPFARSGIAVSSAGDVNGDGVDDLIVGASHADNSPLANMGWTYVVFGRRDGGFPHPLPLAGLNGSNGFRLDGVDAQDFSGRAVSAAGDINGDGVDDLIIGAPQADANGQSDSGSSYVIFGRITDRLFASGFES